MNKSCLRLRVRLVSTGRSFTQSKEAPVTLESSLLLCFDSTGDWETNGAPVTADLPHLQTAKTTNSARTKDTFLQVSFHSCPQVEQHFAFPVPAGFLL